jgi:hypothetical protein
VKKPDPKDYPDKVNAFIRDMRQWLATQRSRSVPLVPPDLEGLFTPLSVQEAKLHQTVDEIRRRDDETH